MHSRESVQIVMVIVAITTGQSQMARGIITRTHPPPATKAITFHRIIAKVRERKKITAVTVTRIPKKQTTEADTDIPEQSKKATRVTTYIHDKKKNEHPL